MTRVLRPASLSALLLALSVSAAQADLTAADVWADWKSYMTSSGYTVTANESTSSGRVTVSDLSMGMDLSDDEQQSDIMMVMDSVVFTENGDGTVSVELPETAALNFNTTSPEGDKVRARVDYLQAGPAMSVSGSPDDMVYDYTADALTLRLAEVNVGGVLLTEEIAKLILTMSDVAYVTETGVTDMRSIAQEMSASGLTYDIFFKDPKGQGTFKLAGAMQGLTFVGQGDLPIETDTDDFNAMLNDGFNFGGTFDSAGGTYDLAFESPDGSGTINSTSTGASLELAMGADGITYAVEQSGLNMNMLMSEVPLPISFSAETTAMNLAMPVQKADEAQDFAMGVTLQDFTMSDMIWGIFDPAGQLPRDPATLVVDLTGKAKVLFDILDPAQAVALEQSPTPPAELNALTLTKLELDAVGARLTGEGAFTFDNSDLVTFDGMPRPQGGLDLKLVGGNGLIDKLVGMGLLPEEQAMGARMMMGLFAVPGDGEDTLNSRIEVNEEGHVLANGQRLR